MRHETQRVFETRVQIDPGDRLALGAGISAQAGHQLAHPPGGEFEVAHRRADAGDRLDQIEARRIRGKRTRPVGIFDPGIEQTLRQTDIAEGSLEAPTRSTLLARAARRAVTLGGEDLAREPALRMAREHALQIFADICRRTQHGRDRVVELVGDPGGHLAERGVARLLDQIQAGLLELMQCLGELPAFALQGMVKLGLLDLKLIGTSQPFRQGADGDRRHRRTERGLDSQRTIELLEGKMYDLDLGGRTRGEEGALLLCQRQQADDRPGGVVVEPQIAGGRGMVERDAATQHDEHGIHVDAFVDQACAGRQEQTRARTQDAFDPGEQLGRHLMGVELEQTQQVALGLGHRATVGRHERTGARVGRSVRAEPAHRLSPRVPGEDAGRPRRGHHGMQPVAVDRQRQVIVKRTVGQQQDARPAQDRLRVEQRDPRVR